MIFAEDIRVGNSHRCLVFHTPPSRVTSASIHIDCGTEDPATAAFLAILHPAMGIDVVGFAEIGRCRGVTVDVNHRTTSLVITIFGHHDAVVFALEDVVSRLATGIEPAQRELDTLRDGRRRMLLSTKQESCLVLEVCEISSVREDLATRAHLSLDYAAALTNTCAANSTERLATANWNAHTVTLVVVSEQGRILQAQFVDWLERLSPLTCRPQFESGVRSPVWTPEPAPRRRDFSVPATGGIRIHAVSTLVADNSRDRAYLNLVSHALGFGAGSFLNLELREKWGLCYSVSCTAAPLGTAAFLEITASTTTELAPHLEARINTSIVDFVAGVHEGHILAAAARINCLKRAATDNVIALPVVVAGALDQSIDVNDMWTDTSYDMDDAFDYLEALSKSTLLIEAEGT